MQAGKYVVLQSLSGYTLWLDEVGHQVTFGSRYLFFCLHCVTFSERRLAAKLLFRMRKKTIENECCAYFRHDDSSIFL